MKRGPLVAAAVCATVGVLVGYIMIPGQSEQLAMLSRDELPDAALAKANALFESGNREPAILLQTFALNEYAGKYDRALEAFRTYFELRPDDAAAWEKAAYLFDSQGQTELLKSALENIVRLTRDPLASGRLAAFYRLGGQPDDEYRVLRAVEPKGLLPVDALRLASLHFDRNEVTEGAAIIERLDDADTNIDDAGRIQLFVALLELGKFEVAVNRATKWTKASKDTGLQDVLTGYLLNAGADEAALRLASNAQTFADAKGFGRLAGLLADQGRFDLIERLMDDWVGAATQLPPDQLDSYFQELVASASGKGLGTRLFNELFRALGKGGDARIEASYVQAMYGQFGYGGVAPFRKMLRADVLLARPVLASRLMAVEQNSLAARRFLFVARLPELSASAQFDWLALAKELLSPQELVNELARRARSGAVPPEIRKAVLDAVISVGSQPQTMEVWRAFFKSS